MKKKENKNIKKYFTKENIIYAIILIMDISLTIFFAKNTIINYVKIEGTTREYLGNKNNLYFGRNYINLVIMLIVYIYYLIISKYYFKNKLTQKRILIPLIAIIIINIIVFYLFTTKVY